ncbi:MAG: thioredoxin family protein [Nocardioidaceae bacterium]|nr:thioredoxin family protein [Nocardioidaceae bacterium]
MAVESSMVPLGTPIPAFALPDLTGATLSSDALAGAPALVAFVCNHCPYVKHVETRFGEVVAAHPDLRVIAVCSNDAVGYPDDAPPRLAEQAERAGWSFPYLVDESQETGRAFKAACTPDFFLYDAAGALAYRGAMDGSTPGNGLPVTGELLDDAITRVLAGEPVPEPHRPSMGCSIKWRD